MSQYILTYPVDGKIYYSTTPKKAARKAFMDLVKYNNIDQSRVIIKNNNTKKEYNYLLFTNKKLNEYKKLFDNKNPIQMGGASNISDKEFYEKLSELSGNINMSVSELSQVLKNKYEPKENKELVLLVKEGINKLDNINKNINNINQEVYNIRNKFVPEIKTGNDSDDSISSPRNLIIQDKIIPKPLGKEGDKNIAKPKITKYENIEEEEESGGFCTIM